MVLDSLRRPGWELYLEEIVPDLAFAPVPKLGLGLGLGRPHLNSSKYSPKLSSQEPLIPPQLSPSHEKESIDLALMFLQERSDMDVIEVCRSLNLRKDEVEYEECSEEGVEWEIGD